MGWNGSKNFRASADTHLCGLSVDPNEGNCTSKAGRVCSSVETGRRDVAPEASWRDISLGFDS